MKSRHLMLLAAITLFAALAIPVGLAAQDNQDQKHKHHHYKLNDLGTFGGPQSWVWGWDEFADSMSNRGGLMGGADTSAPNPNYPNFNPFMGLPNVGYPLNSDPYTQHAFQSKHGALIDLGVLPGGYNSFAQWISGNGTVAGASENGATDPLTGWPEVRAVLWEGGQPKDLGTFGGNESLAFAVNNRKQVVGMATNTISDPFGAGTQIRAFIWQKGSMRDLGSLGTGTDAIASFINESGQVAGGALTSDTGSPQQDSFFWEDNGKGMQDIGSLGGSVAYPNAMNNGGQVIGVSNTPGDASAHGFFWDKKHGLVDLGTLGGTFSVAEWINDAGDIVGIASGPNDQFFHAALWRKLRIHDLGTLAGSPCGRALSINSGGQIVGFADNCSDTQKHALLWENGGSAVDLNDLIPPGSSLQLLMGNSINDRGEIGGQGADSSGNNHAFLLIPCDEHHPGIEGCDYSMVEAHAAVTQTSPAVRSASCRTLPQSLMRRYHFPGFAIGSRN
jgi:probable HAF family extracellular repeat protein